MLSDHVVDELVAYLKLYRPEISRRWILSFRKQLQKYCYEYDIGVEMHSRDPKDSPILALAKTQSAFIISGDKDVLEHQNGAIPPVLSIAEYEELFMS